DSIRYANLVSAIIKYLIHFWKEALQPTYICRQRFFNLRSTKKGVVQLIVFFVFFSSGLGLSASLFIKLSLGLVVGAKLRIQ
ncbi:hypothetical protein Q1149_02440, partial [Salmonella enterica subsp. enterica serovar Senftenberg]|uniref:hypothetical protein n=1 Tax=Salmonella enterica TaxID=28901 RepID=UPI00265BD049